MWRGSLRGSACSSSNAFEESGIDADTADEYLADGIHMTPLGARVYAEKLAKIIHNDYAPEE